MCKQVKSRYFDNEKQNIYAAPADIIGNSGPGNAPAALISPIMPTMEAAASGVMPATSCAMGEATAKSPMPQVMLVKNIHHSA